ncbi:class II fructose-bisphosphate aldolase [Paenibacillus sacheonensis]|uniref:Ketose-bisphosphate aldolase n=1 Tax=Paenibacillus sacheonensis TaxID=742054 RepID=A0A7X4YRB7_9BACL|nr:class II fructose-bisphosphate aldolase [Paenibacillus sacheonensis]MBM7565083.1 fructose-bisphosphate aldolase class II [Paenibacillus sacheonensis]NBC70134.1 ketose-bisphosphate aldolase [Paenibacillus sacheonensis]
MTRVKPSNVVVLKKGMEQAEKGGYALGSFSPRYTPMIAAVLRAGERTQSPLIVQISSKELDRYGITPKAFADEFYACIESERITVPVVLHLDHTKDMAVIREAIAAGFTSVMIDASEKRLEDNIADSKEAADYAHRHGVSVEAELGMIGTTDFVETDKDEELFTDPQEALRFVGETGVDALAVSCGTAHGVYMVKLPSIDYKRLQAIRALTPVHLVLHGGSGVPAEMMKQAILLPGGGVSKVNIATDLELAFLAALGREERMTNEACKRLSPEDLEKGRAAVEAVVADKMTQFLGCAGKAGQFAYSAE